MHRPIIQQIKKLSIPAPQTAALDNGIPLTIINTATQPVARIDVLSEGGRCDSQSQLTSEFVASMLREGTESMTSDEIADKVDFYGSWISGEATSHNTTHSLYATNRHFNKVLPIFADMIFHPSFPEHELSNLKTSTKNRLLTYLQKVNYLASSEFAKKYFGQNHNLGRKTDNDEIHSINRQQLFDFHHTWIRPSNMKIIVSGAVPKETIEQINAIFGSYPDKSTTGNNSASDSPMCPFCPDLRIINKSDAIQSAIRIGLPAIQRKDPEYIPLRILITALGGYFGSRLMTNIREEKGYTYGIYAGLTGYRNNAFITITSQCATEYTLNVIAEIKHEMERLKTDLIPEEELSRVRSYMLSDLARTLDTPFSIGDYYASLIKNQINLDYFNRQVEIINCISASELREIARKYLDTDHMLTIIAGNKIKLEKGTFYE